jgi:hypothetical protein
LPLFKRYAHQQPLAKPLTEKEKGDAWKLLEYINIKADDENSRLALLCSVISYFIPLIAHPAIVASGAQGTCKSWFFNVIRQVSDPSSIPLLTVPKDAREMAQHLEHNWLTPYDNISNLPDWASDMLCRAVTGGGIAVRKLYTDDEDIILNFKRCVMLNGINVSAQRGDLLDRAMIFALEPISKRKTEKQLSTDFENAKSIILTGFLNVLSQALKIYPSVELKEIQRLSDFHFYGCAIAQALGKKQEQFSDAYREKVKQQNDEALTDQVALAVLKFAELTVKPIDAMDATGTSLKSYWIDQPSALFAKLNYIAVNILSIDIKTNKGWPRSPNALTRKINVLIPNLKAVGVEIVNYQGTPRKISIDAKKLIVKESPVDQQLPQLPQLTQLKQGGLEKNKLSNNPIIKPILPGVTEVSGVAGVVSEISKPKPQFMFKSIPAAEKCGNCSSFAVTKEVLTPQGATLRKCEECFKKLQTAFPNATFQEEGPKKLLSDL